MMTHPGWLSRSRGLFKSNMDKARRQAVISAIANRDIKTLLELTSKWEVFYREGANFVREDGTVLSPDEYMRLQENPRFNSVVIADVPDATI